MAKILAIDDEYAVRESLKFIFKNKEGFELLTAPGYLEGLFILSHEKIDVVFLDIKMPGKDGISLLEEIKAGHPNVEIIMMTAYSSFETIQRAVRLGAVDYIEKPFNVKEVLDTTQKAYEIKKNKILVNNKLNELQEANDLFEQYVRKIKSNLIRTIELNIISLLQKINSYDNYTWRHSLRVSSIVDKIALMIGYNDDLESLKCAATIHDVGKIKVNIEILKNKGQLTVEEMSHIRQHPLNSFEIISKIDCLKDIGKTVLHHHEKFDGTGYPHCLKYDKIPLEARILTIADAIDSILHAPYKKRNDIDMLIKELNENKGKQFDPDIVDALNEGNLLYSLL